MLEQRVDEQRDADADAADDLVTTAALLIFAARRMPAMLIAATMIVKTIAPMMFELR